ncbi:MAG: hypothetical protein K2H85_01420 [Allobaculum sp.]|nr:hypothetical protein [Allobaculum sp.]
MEALQKSTISGAILDVFDPELPLPANSPLLELPNVILTVCRKKSPKSGG